MNQPAPKKSSGYKARRKREILTKARKTEHLMVVPEKVKPPCINKPLPERVPLELDGRTTLHVRVSTIEADEAGYSQKMGLSIDQLRRLVAARRYTPAPTPKTGEARTPSFYIADQFHPYNGL